MRIVTITVGALAAVCVSLAPAYAGQKGKDGNPHVTSAAPQTHGNPHATSATPQTHGNPHTTPSTAPTHGNPHGTTTTTSSTPTTTKTHGKPHATPSTPAGGTTSAVQPVATTPTTPLNPIAEKLQGKPLGTRLEQILVPTGMSLDTASSGFRNQGQFVAAVHVSQNLGIPFANLKTLMVGVAAPGATVLPASSPMSLGQAIQQLKPFTNGATEAARAEHEAEHELTPTTSTTTTSPTQPTTAKKSKPRGK